MTTDYFTTAQGRFRGLFLALPRIGELWLERDDTARGRWWLDASRHENALELFAGRTYVVLTASRLALFTGGGLLALMGLEVAGITDIV